MSVKGTNHPLVVLEFGFYQGLAASFTLSERHTSYITLGGAGFSGGFTCLRLNLRCGVKRSMGSDSIDFDI